MTYLTPPQLAAATAQIRRIRLAENRIATLTSTIAAYEAQHAADNLRRFERTYFLGDPNLFAGILDVYRRTDGETRRAIRRSYDLFIDCIGDSKSPPPPINYATLTPAARPFLLAPYLKLMLGDRFPRLDLASSSSSLTYVSTGGPIAIGQWRPLLPTIGAWLGGAWEIASSTANSITLARRAPLPAIIPFDPRHVKQGALFLGIDVDTREPAYIPFAGMTSGTFIPGTSGSGKTNALHILLQSVFRNLALFTEVYIIDGKDGVAAVRYRNAAPGKVHVLWDEPEVWQLTTRLVATMRARNAQQREAGIDNAAKDFILVVIDEMSTFTAKPSSNSKSEENKLHARFLDELAMLARRGRSVGIRLIIIAQEPVDDQIPTTVRSNCQTTIAFRVPTDIHATTLFGKIEALPTDPRSLTRGRALIKHGLTGEIRTTQFPVVTSRRP